MKKGIFLFLLGGAIAAGLMGCRTAANPTPAPAAVPRAALATSVPATPTTVAEGPTAEIPNAPIPTTTPQIVTAIPQNSNGGGTTSSTGAAQPTPHGDGSCTYRATFVADVTVPDNTVMLGGSSFNKVWRVRNDGTCSWGSGGFALHSLVMTGGNMGGPTGTVEIPNQAVNQGDEVDFSVPLAAPTNPGLYRSEWKMRVDNGTLLGVGTNGAVPLYAQIVVPSNAPTPAPSGARINFAPGATQAVVVGSLPASASEDYTLKALQGQTMMLTLAGPENGQAQMQVLGPGVGPRVIRETPGSFWLGTLPVTGDYIIRLIAGNAPSNFSLNVTVPQRITFSPGNTSGVVTGKTAARRVVSYLLRAMEGQTMTVTINSNVPNSAGLTVYGLSDGIPLVRASSGATSWTGQLPATQDCVIEIVPAVDTPFNFTVTTTVQ